MVEMKNYFSIAIDGPSGAGKSSMAKALAGRLGYVYVDTGAIYRTVALYCIKNNINCKDVATITENFDCIHIDIQYDSEGTQVMLLNGENVSAEIRLPEVSIGASDVSSLPPVREFLLKMQRDFADRYNVIMDGRDIGTVVLPDADVKIFLTASTEARARRRYLELVEKGNRVNYADVLKDMEYRDAQDTGRETAPLRAAEDAVIIDSSEVGFEETFNILFDVVANRILVSESNNE